MKPRNIFDRYRNSLRCANLLERGFSDYFFCTIFFYNIKPVLENNFSLSVFVEQGEVKVRDVYQLMYESTGNVYLEGCRGPKKSQEMPLSIKTGQ